MRCVHRALAPVHVLVRPQRCAVHVVVADLLQTIKDSFRCHHHAPHVLVAE